MPLVQLSLRPASAWPTVRNTNRHIVVDTAANPLWAIGRCEAVYKQRERGIQVGNLRRYNKGIWLVQFNRVERKINGGADLPRRLEKLVARSFVAHTDRIVIWICKLQSV